MVLCLALLAAGAGKSRAHGNYAELLASVNLRLAAEPGSVPLLLERASLHVEHGELAAAEGEVEAVRTAEPGSSGLLLVRARLDRKLGKLDAAKLGLAQYLAAVPKDTTARRERMTLLEETGDAGGALAEADAVLALPGGTEPDVILARVRLTEAAAGAAGSKGAGKALAWLEEWMDHHPRLPVLEAEALRLETRLGRVTAVLVRYDRLISAAPRPEFLLLRKAQFLVGAGRLPEARAEAQKALAAVDKLPDHLKSLPATEAVRTGVAEVETAAAAAGGK